MKNIDISELINAADPKDVVNEFGIENIDRGSYTFILCPHPSHNDNRIGSAWLTPHGYVCKSCGASGNTLKMVADFLDMPYETYRDKQNVAKLVASRLYPEFLNGAEYISKYKLKSIPFSNEDLEMLGFTDSRPKNYKKTTDNKRNIQSKEDVYFDGVEYCVYDREVYSLRKFYNEDEAGFLNMVKERALWIKSSYNKILRSGKLDENPIYAKTQLIQYAKKAIQAANRILKYWNQEETDTNMYVVPFDFSTMEAF